MAIVTVTGPDGKPYQVDTKYLKSAEEPLQDNFVGWTANGQLYQRVSGKWFRLLRTDEVDFVKEIQPQLGLPGTSGVVFAFSVGRDVNYNDPISVAADPAIPQ